MLQEKIPKSLPRAELLLQGYSKVSESFVPLPAGSEGGVDGWLVETTMELPGQLEDSPGKPREDVSYSETDGVVPPEHRSS